MKKLAILLVMLLAFTMCTANASGSLDGMRTYSAGQYRVGTDITAGEYMLICTSDYGGGYYRVSSDANGRDIIDNDNFDVNRIVTVQYGDYFTLQRCIAVSTNEFYTKYTMKGSNPGVMLKVGYDIAPGTYRLRTTNTRNEGFFGIYDSSRAKRKNIYKNGFFENNTYVTVSRGQYLVLDWCVIDN